MQQPQRPQPQERVQSSSSYSSLLRNAPPTSAARVVDIDAIELEKENIHPIRQGRSATLLTRLFSTQPGDRARELALQHQRFQEELEQIDELDDPLDVFTRYINWTIENYPQGSAQSQESHLVDLLERAIKSLKDEQRYRNDLRFVKLYILYAEIVEFPVEIYKFMEKHNIGTELSLYYEAYAEYLEAMEEMDKAGEILLLGTHRRAHPLKRLQRKYEEFRLREQHRREEQEREDMEAIAIDQASQQSHPTATHPSSANPTRRVLGDRVSASESVHPNTSALRRIPGQGSSSSRSLNTSSSQRPNNKLAVYSDTSSQSSSQATRPPNPTQRTQTPHRSEEWRDLGSDQVHRKENTQEATSWKGAKLTDHTKGPTFTTRTATFKSTAPNGNEGTQLCSGNGSNNDTTASKLATDDQTGALNQRSTFIDG
ncbi:Mad3/BUB1 homology region 1-domain-containing protein [Mortierella sp. GBAus27b]|nr:Mad3/BUB1 homology region 1-domain-containing protein [Mortierella sp. GBAus27b]